MKGSDENERKKWSVIFLFSVIRLKVSLEGKVMQKREKEGKERQEGVWCDLKQHNGIAWASGEVSLPGKMRR